ncbi:MULTISPECIES: GNAT family N-acetyltransferase [unclassified Fusibacter]|uniref:GNAT family N-acetyltransferase n=1 Tax=unclassified Fusibacter TaxID=2624464 RepID=UPI0010110931|nr:MULTISPECIES: GNAT family N-acetyltransferase [unclassified Fusibacter]MCK8061408.1 GNAT family N-acetyltransferase [Fusibacter sp. A2]NPE23549.1 GNAT family N-acetyltransferase [Fusibacter sp. A1]RXV58959.1 N-acetyltransferase [Fusibacter sp. A1]
MIRFKRCDWEEIEEDVIQYYEDHAIVVDSYWEDHVIASNHYKLVAQDKTVGFFAVHKTSMLTLFHVDGIAAQEAQELFKRARKYEQVVNAMVPTGDEMLLSLCIDDYQKIEKNAYFSVYTDKDMKEGSRKQLELIPVTTEDQFSVLDLAVDFWGENDAQRALDTQNHFNIYLVQDNDELIGFGVIEYGRIVRSAASIGMYVLEEKREQGYAKNILKSLQELVESKGYEARSGCWYYNHNSKKSMEAAGAYAKSRLLRFYF